MKIILPGAVFAGDLGPLKSREVILMKVQEIRTLAKGRGLKPGRLAKTDLVRMLQKEEGNFDCFATAVAGDCDQLGCMWREDCFRAATKMDS